MTDKATHIPFATPYEVGFAKRLKNPTFKTLWEEGAARRELTKAIIGERIKRKMSQAQLAARAGLKQPNVARLERGRIGVTIDMLGKIAQAFDAQLEIRFRSI